MGGNASDLFHLRVPCDREAPSVARDAVDRCEEIKPVRDDARLIASELVTNAVVHSGCDPTDTLEIQAVRCDDRVVISVTDPGTAGEDARLRVEDDPARGGFGLRVVQRLAERWGAERWGVERRDGQRVWAEIVLRARAC